MTKVGRVARLKNAHLTAKDVDDLVRETDREDTLARVFLHHLAICPECNAAGGFILDAFVAGEIDETLDRLSLDLSRSRLSAPTLFKELEGWAAPQEWKRIVRKKRRFWTWGLAEFLCDRTLERSHEPAAALATAELAVEVGTRISGWEDDDWIRLLRGYVWAHLMHARRSAGDFTGAWQAMVKANELWGSAIANYGDVLGYKDRFEALMLGRLS